MEIVYQIVQEYRVRAKCAMCKRAEESIPLISRDGQTDAMREAFAEKLAGEGWLVEGPICPDCRRRIVRETVDQLTAAPEPTQRGGEVK